MKKNNQEQYDVAFSFAGEDREFVEKVASYLSQRKLRVFYDRYEEVYLWGKDLGDILDEIYRFRSQYVIFFISKYYAEKMWTNHERKSALSRAIQEKREYVLPARFDSTELPGLSSSIAYIDLSQETFESFGSKIITKIAGKPVADQWTIRHEEFNDEEHWSHLLKIGDWMLNREENFITGSHISSYPLSQYQYGGRQFTISTKLRFYNYQRFAHDAPDTANAGIVLGWKKTSNNHSYYNLLFSGTRLLLEEVGSWGGSHYRDYRHLDAGVEFSVEEAKWYSIAILVNLPIIDVFIDDRRVYSVTAPPNLVGKVGLRPWRSRIECSHFHLTEL